MKLKQAYLILPKESSYTYKDDEIRRTIDNTVNEWRQQLQKVGLSICCFAEDLLAVKLLNEFDNIKWLTVLGKSDTNFMLKLKTNYPTEYVALRKNPVNERFIREAIQKYKVGRPTDFIDRESYLGSRNITLSKRLRYVSERVLSSEKVIVYFNANNNYCKIPSSTVGDEKLLIVVELIKGNIQYTFGGIPLSKEEFEIILRSLEV